MDDIFSERQETHPVVSRVSVVLILYVDIRGTCKVKVKLSL
jgi:hypothetical protein